MEDKKEKDSHLEGNKDDDYSFIGAIKQRFERDIERITHLDNKATNMVTMDGAISAALLTIASFLVNIMNEQNWILGLEILIIFIGVILSSLAIIFFLLALKTRDFSEVFGAEIYFENGKYKKDLVDKFRTANKETSDRQIEDYLWSNYRNRKMIIAKGKYLRYGQWLFGASIISVSVVLVSVLLFSASGQTNINFTNPEDGLPSTTDPQGLPSTTEIVPNFIMPKELT